MINTWSQIDRVYGEDLPAKSSGLLQHNLDAKALPTLQISVSPQVVIWFTDYSVFCLRQDQWVGAPVWGREL